jgi:cytochrome b6-f complex iron-sulfur subunit
MEKFNGSRRGFIKTLIFFIGSAAFLWKFFTPRSSRKKILLRVKKADIPSTGALVFRESRVAVIRWGNEIYALNLICTHLGCTVNVTPGELVCPCHGSVFDRHGKVLKGPANRALERFVVEDHGEYIAVLS